MTLLALLFLAWMLWKAFSYSVFGKDVLTAAIRGGPEVKGSMKFVRSHPIIMTVVLLCVVRAVWNPVMNVVFSGRHVIRDPLEGEWVGTVEITGGYNPVLMGETPGPHKQAVVHFNLEIEHVFEVDYKGPGEFFIIGEDKARKIEIADFSVGQGTSIDAHMEADPDFAGGIDGSYSKSSPDEMTITTSGELQFEGKLRHGTVAEYDALVKELQGQPLPSRGL